MIKWIQHKIKLHEHKCVFKELERLGNKSKRLKQTYQTADWSDEGMAKYAKKFVEDEYYKVSLKYSEFAKMLMRARLDIELDRLHMQIFNTKCMPNNINRTRQEELDWNK